MTKEPRRQLNPTFDPDELLKGGQETREPVTALSDDPHIHPSARFKTIESVSRRVQE